MTDRKPPRYSATRVKTFVECPRKWHLYNVRGWDDTLEEQGYNPAFEFGTKMHAVAEDWLKKGTPPPDNEFGEAFAPGVKYWPAPKTTDLVTEHGFEISTFSDVCFRGVIDVLHVDGDHALVGDHKTTSNLKYAMTPEQLSKDIQAIAYGYYAVVAFNVQNVTLRWVYYSKKKPQAKCVEVTLPCQHFIKRWGEIMEKSKKMLDQWTKHDYPENIAGNENACDNYGGCEFRAQCKKLKKEKDVGALEKLREQKKAAEAAGTDAEPKVKSLLKTKKATGKLPPKKEATSKLPIVDSEPVENVRAERVMILLKELIKLVQE